MAVKIMIPTPLRQYVGKKDQVEVEARTVAEALSRLATEYGDLRRHLYSEEGKLRSFVNIYLGDEDIRFLQREQTPLNENDVLSIVPSIAGGTALRCICLAWAPIPMHRGGGSWAHSLPETPISPE